MALLDRMNCTLIPLVMKRMVESRRSGTAGMDSEASALTLAQISRDWNDKTDLWAKIKDRKERVILTSREPDRGLVPLN